MKETEARSSDQNQGGKVTRARRILDKYSEDNPEEQESRPPDQNQGGKVTRARRILDKYPSVQDRKGRRVGGGGSLQRTEVVTIRLDPKLRYLAELAARKQRRTVSSFVESAVENELHRVLLRETTVSGSTVGISVGDEGETLWDTDDPDRLAKLGLHYPELLTYDEQVLWKLIRETGSLWQGEYNSHGDWMWKVEPDALLYDRLRENWRRLIDVAAGEADRRTLPQRPRKASADSKDVARSSNDDL